jgi:hypothetical protein
MLVARQGRRHRIVCNLRKRRQRRIALKRLRERRGARLADLVAGQAVARRRRRVRDARGETGPLAQSRARATYSRDVSVALLLSASESAAAPASPIWLAHRLQRGEVGQGCSWRDRTASTDKGAARATYPSNVSVALLLSASESAEAPASPIRYLYRVLYRLQRGEEGQGCSWRDRAAGS